MSQKYLPDLRRCITHIQMEDEIKLLHKIIRGKKQQNRHPPRDPIISKVYVGWQQNLSTPKKRTHTHLQLSENFHKVRQSFREKQFTDQRVNQAPYSKSNKTNFNLRTQESQQKRRVSDFQMYKQVKIQNEGDQLKKIIQVEDDTQKVRNKLSKLVSKVFNQKNFSKSKQKTIQKSEISSKNKSNKNKQNNIAKKLKRQNIKRIDKPRQKIPKQWCQIDILKLRTYFVKLQTNQVQNPKQISNNQPISLYDNIYVPSKQKIPEYIRQYKPINQQIDVDQLVKDPNFQIIIDENSLYFGCISYQKRSGKGIYVCKNHKFQGNWAHDSKNDGVQITKQGYYKGSFKNDVRNGQGEFFWKNGEKYQGQWRAGVKHGSGIWKSGKGDSYLGKWTNSKVEGYGVHICANGQRYQGNFKNFLKHGQGVQSFPNGDKFQGQYKNGKPNGFGKYTWKNQIFYEGQFVEGYRHGKGKIIADKYMRYVGDFLGQKPYGKGQIFYENGDRFVGQFKQGYREGYGSLKLKNKHRIIQGIWHKNEYEGQIQDEQNSYEN